ncbi:unnamed protein product [Lactuca saligna]|uniref:Uncharacterized protein n=1 Tax=Lactuca saligna TaxID=75948 RepID=A0AA36ELW2_LACSI|nr:unnamed protein product [Lactuca saligna]
MYPSLKTKDLTEKLFPNNDQSHEQEQQSTTFESSEEVVIKIPKTTIHLVPISMSQLEHRAFTPKEDETVLRAHARFVSGFCFNLSSPSRFDVSDSNVHVYWPVTRSATPVKDPLTSLSLSVPVSESFEASSMSATVAHPPRKWRFRRQSNNFMYPDYRLSNHTRCFCHLVRIFYR